MAASRLYNVIIDMLWSHSVIANESQLCGVTADTSWCHIMADVLQLCSTTADMLRSNPASTFSLTAPSAYTPSYKTSDTWDCITIIYNFSNTVSAYTFNILPCLAPKLVDLGSLLHFWPYFSHCFTEFRPYCTDGDPTELQLTAQPH